MSKSLFFDLPRMPTVDMMTMLDGPDAQTSRRQAADQSLQQMRLPAAGFAHNTKYRRDSHAAKCNGTERVRPRKAPLKA